MLTSSHAKNAWPMPAIPTITPMPMADLLIRAEDDDSTTQGTTSKKETKSDSETDIDTDTDTKSKTDTGTKTETERETTTTRRDPVVAAETSKQANPSPTVGAIDGAKELQSHCGEAGWTSTVCQEKTTKFTKDHIIATVVGGESYLFGRANWTGVAFLALLWLLYKFGYKRRKDKKEAALAHSRKMDLKPEK